MLEILKLRRLRAWQLRRADPDTSEHEIDEEVERELETGEFTRARLSAIRTGFEPECVANRTCEVAGGACSFAATDRHARRREEVSRT